MELTNEIIEQHGFKRINNSTWRKGNWTLQNGWTHEGITLHDKIFNTKKAYKLCIDGKYSQMITTVELFESLVRGREVDAGISKCNKHIVTNRFIKEQSERQNAILEKAVRENAVPPLKGEITKGKVRWRGLRIIQKGGVADGFTETWIEQRGKRITPIIRNEYNYQLP